MYCIALGKLVREGRGRGRKKKVTMFFFLYFIGFLQSFLPFPFWFSLFPSTPLQLTATSKVPGQSSHLFLTFCPKYTGYRQSMFNNLFACRRVGLEVSYKLMLDKLNVQIKYIYNTKFTKLCGQMTNM